jgi:hypothetical protein
MDINQKFSTIDFMQKYNSNSYDKKINFNHIPDFERENIVKLIDHFISKNFEAFYPDLDVTQDFNDENLKDLESIIKSLLPNA